MSEESSIASAPPVSSVDSSSFSSSSDLPVSVDSRKRPLDPLDSQASQDFLPSPSPADGAPVKKSRWGARVPPPPQPPLSSSFSSFSSSPPALSPDQVEFVQLQARIALLSQLLSSNDSASIAAFFSLPNAPPRSPSPDPVYDPSTGLRTNTREARHRKKLESERHELVVKALQLNPAFKPPAGWKRSSPYGFTKKIPIPVDEFPNYNFRGQIIGPRGSTQQKLERELQCKIVIRGRGSVPDGKSTRSTGPSAASADEPLHVLIQADTQEKLDKAESVVTRLLVPKDDRINEHKTQQLRELALYNGTLRDEIICRRCNKAGHKMFECPLRESSWQPAEVSCKVCGGRSHVSSDCPHQGDLGRSDRRDRELENFIETLRGEDFVQAKNAAAQRLFIEGQQETTKETTNIPFIHPARQIANGLKGLDEPQGHYENRQPGHHQPHHTSHSSSHPHSHSQEPRDHLGRRFQSFEGRAVAREFRPHQPRNPRGREIPQDAAESNFHQTQRFSHNDDAFHQQRYPNQYPPPPHHYGLPHSNRSAPPPPQYPPAFSQYPPEPPAETSGYQTQQTIGFRQYP